MILTGDLILESAKRGISFPSNNANNLSDTDILAFAYEEMVSKIMPIITSLRQEFLIAPSYTITIVSGTQRYRLPQRALGRALRNLFYVDSSLVRRDLPMTKPEDIHKYMPATDTEGVPQAFYIENDYIVLLPIPNQSSTTLEVTYPLRPSKIIKLNDSGVIQSAASSTGIIVLDSALSTITTATACDIISSTSGNIVKKMAITPTSVSGATVTFAASAFGTDVIADDYLCLAEESPVVQIPEEALVALARATQNRILESIDDLEGLKIGMDILNNEKTGLLTLLAQLLTPRVEGKPLVAKGAANRFFISGNRHGYFPRVRV